MAPIITSGKNNNAGFAYMALLVAIAASLVVISTAIPDIYQTAKREREAQFFFAGEQYRAAIKDYYESKDARIKVYPQSLQELINDDRSLKTQHYLRRLYPDPMTKEGKWGLVLNEQQKIIGVYSRSQQTVLKSNFDKNVVTVTNPSGKLRYSDLKFIYSPK